jgi:hypothetical protein
VESFCAEGKEQGAQVSLKTLLVSALSTILAVCCLSAEITQIKSLQPAQNDRDKEWLRDNYAELRQRLLPDQVPFESPPKSTKWMTVVVSRDSVRTSEYWFVLSLYDDGAAKITVRKPRQGSIARELQLLRKESPSESLGNLARAIKVDEWTISDQQSSGLRQLATEFESIRISPVMPDLLMSDPYVYHFWTQARYGQEVSVEIFGPGPNGEQWHPLLSWAERVRLTFSEPPRKDQLNGTELK